MRSQRGFSIAEVLTVTVILGMLMSAIVMILPMMLHAPMQMQSQVDQVNTAALALYKIRRDFSEGDTSGVMGCSTSPVVSCSAVTGPVSVQAMAVVTAENNVGAFQVDKNTGYPLWQGFYIYWLVPNANGTAFDLMRAYEPAAITALNGVPNNINAAMTDLAVTTAMAITPAPVLTNYIEQMKLGDNAGSSTITFQLIAGVTNGQDQTHTDFQSNTYARN